MKLSRNRQSRSLSSRTTATGDPMSLILKTSALAAALSLAACASMTPPKTVADTAAANPQLTTLNKLIADAGMTEQLRGSGPYTVFAPSDDAFKAVPKATLDALAKDKNRLKEVLAYHVVPGTVTVADAKNGPIKTVQGGNLNLSKAG